jgi:D-alanyl-lipoteichoic acid acyltransferase DltB (MBOAT superfamily)
MLFPTLGFVLFFLPVFALSWALAGRPVWRKAVLVAASYGFYAGWDARFTLLLLASSAVAFAAGRLIGRARTDRGRRGVVAAAVTIDLLGLGAFKYGLFLGDSVNAALAGLGLGMQVPLPSIILPVGISFFTFHGISYVVDVYRRQIPATRSPLDMLRYMAFFPQLVAGPILRAAMFLPQIATAAVPVAIPATRALMLIVIGLFKKVIVAQYLAAVLVDPAFAEPDRFGAADLWLAAYGYAVQIYCDFSGYTDMAIGLALLLGYRFPVNFNQPYRAASPREFWRRWHISLSSWLRDYLYKPLGGNRGGAVRTGCTLMATMLLGGLWHGAAWTFVIWGGVHGLVLAVLRGIGARGLGRGVPRWLGIVLTFHFLCLTWVLFRAPDIGTAWVYLAGLIRPGAAVTLATPLALGLLGIGALTQALPPGGFDRAERRLHGLPGVVKGVLLGAAIMGIEALSPEGVAPFIYFQF